MSQLDSDTAVIANEESILLSVKKVLGVDPSYDVFDLDLVMHINSAIIILNQLGVGPDDGFEITGPTTLWTDYLGTDKHLNMVKSFITHKVRLMFDPPANSFTIEAVNKIIAELESRILYLELRKPATPYVVPNVIWDMTGRTVFPPEAPKGAYGLDALTGNLWRNDG